MSEHEKARQAFLFYMRGQYKLEDLGPLKRMIQLKKKPNRKPTSPNAACDATFVTSTAPMWKRMTGVRNFARFLPRCGPGSMPIPQPLFAMDAPAQSRAPRCFPRGDAELKQKIDVEKRWTWDEEKLMQAYACQKNMDDFQQDFLHKAAK